MTKRRTVEGQFVLPTSASAAIGYFTPEGERDWVPGWDPRYPAGEQSESPGTVFTTDADSVSTIWVIHHIDRDAGKAAYSRVTAGHHAGTVRVRCADVGADRCRVTVEYDMSLLPGGDPAALEAYEDAPFAAMMDEWAAEVGKALASRS